MTSKASELILLGLLVVMIGFIRIYYGGGPGEELMVVWKGEFSYHDTLVNLSDILRMPRGELSHVHPSILYQLEEMGVCDASEVAPPHPKHKPFHEGVSTPRLAPQPEPSGRKPVGPSSGAGSPGNRQDQGHGDESHPAPNGNLFEPKGRASTS